MFKGKMHRPTTPSGILFWGMESGQYSRWCSRTVSFVFAQSGSPIPAWGLIILVTRRPKLSAILNCARHDLNGFGPPFFRLTYKFYRAWWLCIASWKLPFQGAKMVPTAIIVRFLQKNRESDQTHISRDGYAVQFFLK